MVLAIWGDRAASVYGSTRKGTLESVPVGVTTLTVPVIAPVGTVAAISEASLIARTFAIVKFGHARVFTLEQNLELQLKALKKAGCRMIFREKVSGFIRQRPEFQRMLDQIRPGTYGLLGSLRSPSQASCAGAGRPCDPASADQLRVGSSRLPGANKTRAAAFAPAQKRSTA